MKKKSYLLVVALLLLTVLLIFARNNTSNNNNIENNSNNTTESSENGPESEDGTNGTNAENASDSGTSNVNVTGDGNSTGNNNGTGSENTDTAQMPTPPIAPPDSYKTYKYEKLAGTYNIPIINVYTKDREEVLSLEEYVECVVDVFNCDKSYTMNNVAAGIRVRGNSSAHYGDVDAIREQKAPYRIKFEEKQNMLGLNDGAECKSWVLLKTDWNLIANDVAFRMADAIFDGHAFCSDSTYVHLYINEELQGIYLLCEQSQVNENRVDIYEPGKNETGTDIGYYMEIDNYAAGEKDGIYFYMDYENATVTDIEGVTRAFCGAEYSIKSEIRSDEQVEFIDGYMNNLFRALYEACENDLYLTVNKKGNLVKSNFTSSYEVADALLDLESVVNMYILYEIVHDNDCGEGSFYMCIDFSKDSKVPKLQFTSPWDFNWAYTDEPAGQYYAAAFNNQEFVDTMGDRSNPWFILLMTEDWFVEMVREKWAEIRSSNALEHCLLYEDLYVKTHDDEIHIMESWIGGGAQDTLSWLRTRIEWLDGEWLDSQ